MIKVKFKCSQLLIKVAIVQWAVVGVTVAADAQIEARLLKVEQVLGSGLLYETLDRLDRVEAENRALRGLIEGLKFQLESAANASPALALPAAPQIAEGLNTPVATVGTISQSPQADVLVDTLSTQQTPASPPVSVADEQARYDSAFEAMKAGQYAIASKTFQSISNDYPEGVNRANSMYWHGEAEYLLSNFQSSFDSMQRLILLFPNERRVPDALVRQALALRELGDEQSAQEMLRKVIDSYPETAASRQAANKLNN